MLILNVSSTLKAVLCSHNKLQQVLYFDPDTSRFRSCPILWWGEDLRHSNHNFQAVSNRFYDQLHTLSDFFFIIIFIRLHVCTGTCVLSLVCFFLLPNSPFHILLCPFSLASLVQSSCSGRSKLFAGGGGAGKA